MVLQLLTPLILQSPLISLELWHLTILLTLILLVLQLLTPFNTPVTTHLSGGMASHSLVDSHLFGSTAAQPTHNSVTHSSNAVASRSLIDSHPSVTTTTHPTIDTIGPHVTNLAATYSAYAPITSHLSGTYGLENSHLVASTATTLFHNPVTLYSSVATAAPPLLRLNLTCLLQ